MNHTLTADYRSTGTSSGNRRKRRLHWSTILLSNGLSKTGLRHGTYPPKHPLPAKQISTNNHQSHVICEPGAGHVIKTYSPNLMVHPYMRQEKNLGANETIDSVSD